MVISSSTSVTMRAVSSEVKIVTPFSIAQRRMDAPSWLCVPEETARVLMT